MKNQNELKELLEYDSETGIWTWLVSRGRAKAGSVAGTIHHHGYRQIMINEKIYRAARLAHFYMTGEWPENDMDHINRIRDDDRWENLRPANRSENTINRGIRKDNTSGHKGVHWCKAKGQWVAQIVANKKHRYLGSFVDLNEAIAARKKAELKYHGEFA